MDPFATRRLGTTDCHLPLLGFGGAPLGELFTRVTEEDATSTLNASWDSGIRYYDTAPWYGRGQSEHRFDAQLWAGRFHMEPGIFVAVQRLRRLPGADLDQLARIERITVTIWKQEVIRRGQQAGMANEFDEGLGFSGQTVDAYGLVPVEFFE